MEINNKKILVTGGAVRIGKALCEGFAAQGAEITIHYNHSDNNAKQLLYNIGGSDGGHRIIKANLSDINELNSLLGIINDIDILINNASVFYNNRLVDDFLEEGKKQFDINFWAPFELMKGIHKSIKKQTVIINMLDYRIVHPSNDDGTYLLSKKSLADVTLLAASQWAPDTRVNGIALGFVIPPVGMEKSTMVKSMQKVPMKKPVTTDEVIDSCRFLINNDSITGEILHLNGGAHL
ncbi:MAG TPA: SDR family oxidoreductase [Victivallales bacterium]|nr:SDR family oxidoreductase [Victivallales bacterium]